MRVDKLLPPTEGSIPFSWAAIGQVPEFTACYVLTAHDKTILYIGQAYNLSRRIRQHLDDPEKRRDTTWGVVQWLYFGSCSSNELSHLERTWIDAFRLANGGDLPPLNKIQPPS